MPDLFTGIEDHQIPLHEAADLTRRYRDAEAMAGVFPVIKGEFFSRQGIQMLLDHPLCVGVRIYYGLKADNTPCMVLVGADAHKNDILDYVLEMGKICPTHCGLQNPLNT